MMTVISRSFLLLWLCGLAGAALAQDAVNRTWSDVSFSYDSVPNDVAQWSFSAPNVVDFPDPRFYILDSSYSTIVADGFEARVYSSVSAMVGNDDAKLFTYQISVNPRGQGRGVALDGIKLSEFNDMVDMQASLFAGQLKSNPWTSSASDYFQATGMGATKPGDGSIYVSYKHDSTQYPGGLYDPIAFDEPSESAYFMIFAPSAYYGKGTVQGYTGNGLSTMGDVFVARPVPEPGLMIAAGAGLAALLARRRRKA